MWIYFRTNWFCSTNVSYVNNNVRDVVITHELSKRRWKEEKKYIKNGIDEDKPNCQTQYNKILSMQSRGRRRFWFVLRFGWSIGVFLVHGVCDVRGNDNEQGDKNIFEWCGRNIYVWIFALQHILLIDWLTILTWTCVKYFTLIIIIKIIKRVEICIFVPHFAAPHTTYASVAKWAYGQACDPSIKTNLHTYSNWNSLAERVHPLLCWQYMDGFSSSSKQQQRRQRRLATRTDEIIS